jgi:hypothetical protein
MATPARNKSRKTTDKMTRKADRRARVTLPSDFASCLVTVERKGDVLHIRKARGVHERRYTFKQLIARVNKDNVHGLVDFGTAVGGEAP